MPPRDLGDSAGSLIGLGRESTAAHETPRRGSDMTRAAGADCPPRRRRHPNKRGLLLRALTTAAAPCCLLPVDETGVTREPIPHDPVKTPSGEVIANRADDDLDKLIPAKPLPGIGLHLIVAVVIDGDGRFAAAPPHPLGL